MSILTILIIFLVVIFLGYPFVLKGKKGHQDVKLKEIDNYIEEQVRSLRSSLRRSAEEARKTKISPPRGLFCPSCGAKISPDDRFCTACGTKLKK